MNNGSVIIDVDLDTGSVERGLREIRGSLSRIGSAGQSAFRGLSTAIKGVTVAAGAVGVAIGAGVGAIGALVESTSELNGDLARLRANADNAGIGFDGLEKSFASITSITGEADSAVEALSNLIQTPLSENEIAEAVELINGAAIRFSDTLKTEGIADGLQETFATGEAIGPFGELLERSGVDLEKFNAGLAKAKKNGTETNFVLDQLNKLGLKGVTEQYKESNAEIVRYNEANVALDLALAQLGKTLTPIISSSKEFATQLIGVINGSNSFSDVLATLSTNLSNTLSSLTGIDASVFQGIFDTAVASITQFYNIVSTNLTTAIETIQTLWATYGPQIIAIIQNVFNTIMSVVMTVLNAVVPFIQTQLVAIFTFFQTYGPQILEAVSTAFTNIKAVIDFVMPAIQLVIQVVWQAIQNVVTGALNIIQGVILAFTGLINGNFTQFWQGIRQLFSGAVDFILGLMTLSFVGGIRAAVTGLVRNFSGQITTLWTTVRASFNNGITGVIQGIGNFVQTVLNSGRNLSTGFVNAIKQLATNTVNAVRTMVSNTVNALVTLPAQFIKIGKDAIQGLLNGLTAGAKRVVDTVKGIGSSILGSIKGVLDIHSPSREMRQIGLFTGDGLVIGLQDSEEPVRNAINKIGDEILRISNENAEELRQLEKENARRSRDDNQKALEAIQRIRSNANKKRRALTKTELAEIAKIERDYQENKNKDDRDFLKKRNEIIERADADYLAKAREVIQDKKDLNEISALQEAELWEEIQGYFQEGSRQYIDAQKAYNQAIEQVNSEIVATNEKYINEIQRIDQEYIKNSQAAIDNYNKLEADRISSLANVKGLFEAFEFGEAADGQVLSRNLESQIVALNRYEFEINKLANRGITGNLLAELQKLGPDALSELEGLNALTDDELLNYQNLYETRFARATEIARNELEQQRKDTEFAIRLLRETADTELRAVEEAWIADIKAITDGTNKQLTTLELIGKNAGMALQAGLGSTTDSLIKTASQIGQRISSALNSALNIDTASFNSSVRSLSQASKNAQAELNLGNPVSSGSNIKNTYNNYGTGYNSNSNGNNGNVYLDGSKVGELITQPVSNNQQSSLSLKSLMKGSN